MTADAATLTETALSRDALLSHWNHYSDARVARCCATWRRDEFGPRCPRCGGTTAIASYEAADVMRACTDCPACFAP